MDFWSGVASNLLGSLLGDLSKFIISKIWNADEDRSKVKETLREKLTELQGTLERVHAEDAGASYAKMPSDWLDALAWCPYEIEDIVDNINLADSNQALTAKLLQTSLTRVTELQTKLEDLERDRQAILSNRHMNLEQESAKQDGRLQHALLVGKILREEKGAVIEKLRCCGFGVAIIGICGIGKTRLAEAIANDASISEDFRCISLPLKSSNFDPQDALEFLKHNKHKRRVLIILDGLESVALADWCLFRSQFLERLHPGSKVLITTQNPQVADTTDSSKYCLRSVSHNDCFLLIRSIVEASGNLLDELDWQSIKHNKNELAEKCKGLPLLASHIGMLLSAATLGRRDKTVTTITTSSLWKQRWMERVLTTLRPISLLAQKPYLQRCVAYCSLFPSNHEFQKDNLVQMWMVEGFTPALSTTEDVVFLQKTAGECFDDLLSHSIFHTLDEPLDEEPSYRMHPLLYDLAQNVASKTICHIHVGNSDFTPSKYVRHLSLSCDSINNGEEFVLKLLSSVKRCHGLRTFLLLHNSGEKIRQNPNFFETLECLRVLDLSHANLTKLSNISKLKHLRYLDLSHTPIKRLPSLSKKFALQVLKLYDCDKLHCLPNDLSQLTSLICLQVNMKSLGAMPRCIGKLTKLQSLNVFIVGNDEGYKIAELKNMNHLRESLSITKLENIKSKSNAQEANLHNKKRLDRLELLWTSLTTSDTAKQVLEGLVPPKNLKELTIRKYNGSEFPQWLSSTEVCGMLKTIHLAHCEACKVLPSLGKLPTLKTLHLETMFKLRTLGHEFFGGGFLCLESLKICNLPNLTEWTQLTVDSMPRLRELEIVNCQRLVKLPPMDHLASLKSLEIHECPQLEELPTLSSSVKSLIITESDILRRRCQVGHPDWHKIRGIDVVIDSETVDTGEENSSASDHEAVVPQSYCIQIEGSAVNETNSRDHLTEHNAHSISMNVIGQLPIEMDASDSLIMQEGSWQHQIAKSQGQNEIQMAKRMRHSTA